MAHLVKQEHTLKLQSAESAPTLLLSIVSYHSGMGGQLPLVLLQQITLMKDVVDKNGATNEWGDQGPIAV